jgi:hypothetical protein
MPKRGITMSERSNQAIKKFFSDLDRAIKIEEISLKKRLKFVSDLLKRIERKNLRSIDYVFTANLSDRLVKVELCLRRYEWKITYYYKSSLVERAEFSWENVKNKMSYEGNDIIVLVEKMINRQYDSVKTEIFIT